MTNPYLRDRIERVIRDTPRKLAWDDRLVGTMRVALDAGVTPHRFALGAAAALETLPYPSPTDSGAPPRPLRRPLAGPDQPPGRKSQLIRSHH